VPRRRFRAAAARVAVVAGEDAGRTRAAGVGEAADSHAADGALPGDRLDRPDPADPRPGPRGRRRRPRPLRKEHRRMWTQIVFWVCAAGAVVTGVAVFRADSMARATFALLASFLFAAGTILLLNLAYLGVLVVLTMIMEM